MELNGVAALVTGAASGLGAATAAAMAVRGATVFGIDLPQAVAQAPSSDHVTLLGADVTSADDVAAALVTVAETGVPLRAVVNCAGIGPSSRILSRRGPHDLDLFAKIFEVDLLGTFNVLRLAAEVMAASEPADEHNQRGVIINTASVAAFEGQIGQVAYAASKGGVHAITATDPAAGERRASLPSENCCKCPPGWSGK